MDVALPAGTSWFVASLAVTGFSGDGEGYANYSHTLSASLAAPADVAVVTDSIFLSVTAVPEPETLALWLAGLGVLALTARKRLS